MSKKSLQRSRLLLDTSFILPVLGFESSARVMRAFQRLGSYELYYNDISVLEALWKIVKVIKGTRKELQRIKEGVIAIKKTMKYAPISGEVVEKAIHMYKLGHKDMIDNLLYSTAIVNKLKLLTVDRELIEFVEKHDLVRDAIITLEELE